MKRKREREEKEEEKKEEKWEKKYIVEIMRKRKSMMMINPG